MVSNAAEILIVFKFAVQRMSFELLLLVTAVNSAAAMKAARNKMVAGEQHCWTAGNDAACWTSVWPIAISHFSCKYPDITMPNSWYSPALCC